MQIFRGIQPTDEFMDLVADELHNCDYTAGQARAAEAWILRGDWSYRGTSPRLELSDFFPSEKQIPVADGFILMQSTDYAAKQAGAYQRGYDAGSVAALRTDYTPVADATAELIAATQARLKSELHCEELERELIQLRRELIQAQNENRELITDISESIFNDKSDAENE